MSLGASPSPIRLPEECFDEYLLGTQYLSEDVCCYFCKLHVYFQITNEIKNLHQEEVQPYKLNIAQNAAEAVKLLCDFEISIHAPAMVCIYLMNFVSLYFIDHFQNVDTWTF